MAHVAAATSPSQASTTAISANTFGKLGGGGTIKIAVEAVFAQLVDEAVGARLDATTLNRLWATLAETGRKPRSIDGAPSGLSSKSIENVAMTVHRMLKDAVRWGRLARNPADAADPPRRSVQTRQVQAWDAETLRRFLSRCRTADDPLYSLWVFLATTGLRRGEALGLDWADVDLAAARVRITHTLGSIRWNLVAGSRRHRPVDDRSPSIRSP